MRRLATSISALGLVGCGPRPIDVADMDTQVDVSGSDSDESDGESGADMPMDLPECIPLACEQACAQENSECFEPLLGACRADGTCECVEARPCPPCVDEECPPFEDCTSAFGICSLDQCEGEWPLVIDPPGSCEGPTPELTDFTIPHVYIYIADAQAAYVEDCAVEVDFGRAWTWVVPGERLLLCAQACTDVVEGADAAYGWGISCE
jgi:hypothetical protein